MIDRIPALVASQQQFASQGHARDVDYRKARLQKLKAVLKENESKLCEALYRDIKKSAFETYLTELGIVYHEIDTALKHVSKWSKTKRVKTDLANLPGQSFIVPEPFGMTLVIGAWNYPYQLTLAPLVAAMAAGNTCIVKPSELTANASTILRELINDAFDPVYLHVIEGGVEVTQALLRQRFDKIFFTGSTQVGKIVAKAASEHLTPVTLELGGKSPCLVLADADLNMSAQRILWGKFLNAGQTCIAPDYVLVEQSVYQPFLEAIRAQLPRIVGADPKQSDSYVRMVNAQHVRRLQTLIDPSKVYMGGTVNEAECYVEPTILKDVTFDDTVMQEEIFGPILPIIPFSDLDAVLTEIKTRPKPLAFYLFSQDAKTQHNIIEQMPFGGGCINDVVMHITNRHLPFGGVGTSGMGSYHGEFGFRTFSHFKGVMKKSFWFEAPLKYAPHTSKKLGVLRRIFG